MQDFGEKEALYMPRKTQDEDMPIGKVTIIDDFLPSPEELVFGEEKQKITISLSKDSIDFFKQLAKAHHTKYQPLIRKLLEKYVEKYSHR